MSRKSQGAPKSEGRPQVRRIPIVNLHGSLAEKNWLEHVHRKTRLARTIIVRLALASWAATQNLPAYPDPAGSVGGEAGPTRERRN